MKLWISLLAGLMCSGQALAFGETGRWSSGWGQGMSEYIVVDAHQNQLYIACSNDEQTAATMTLTVNGKRYGYQEAMGFSLIIDGKQVDVPYDASTHVGSESFKYAWDALRKAKSLQAKTDNGLRVTLPLTGVAKALPARSSKSYSCNTWF